MLLNSTSSTFPYFILGAYLPVGNVRFLYFALMALLYVVIVVVNVSLIVIICVNRSLHEPMYTFLCGLFLNELYGGSGLFPFLLLQVLSDVHTVPASFCFLQIFCLYTYANTEICILAAMSYDRYVAICCPLQYNTRMTCKKVALCVIVLWLYSSVKCLITLSLNLQQKLCGNILNSLYCHNYLIVKQLCSRSKLSNVYGLCIVVLSVLVPLVPILYSYMKIIQVCFSGSRQTRHRAFSTCLPHLVSLLSFSFGCLFAIVQTRFDMTSVPNVLRIILSLYFSLLQPVLSPIVYGLQMSKIRNTWKHLAQKVLTAHRQDV